LEALARILGAIGDEPPVRRHAALHVPPPAGAATGAHR